MTPSTSTSSTTSHKRASRRDRVLFAYCAGEAASAAGSAVHTLALPVVAVVELGASPGQVAILAALSTTPALLVSLPSGVIADRLPKRAVMIATDLASAATAAVIPVCWTIGALSMAVVYAAALVLGTLHVIGQAAACAVVPELVPPDQVAQANARSAAATSVADTAGTFAATTVIAHTGAARLLLLDALSYLISAWCASRLPRTTPALKPASRPRVITEIRSGIRFVRSHPLLRPQLHAVAVYALAEGAIATFWGYWLLTHIRTGSTGLGLILGTAAVGGLAGALAAPRLANRFGPGPILLTGFLAYPLNGALLLAAGPGPTWLAALAAGAAVQTMAAIAAGTTQRTLRQHLTPQGLQSRAQQTFMWVNAGARPFAALAAGALANATDVRTALTAAVALHTLPVAMLWASPIRHLTTMPAAPPAPPPSETEARLERAPAGE